MRQWINLFENTKTQEKIDIGVAPGIAGDLSTRASSDIKAFPGKAADVNAVPGKTANTKATIAPLSAQGQQHLSDLMNSGLEDDIDVPVTDGFAPVTPETLPAVISKEIAEHGEEFSPEWHQVKNLPGYMASAIRAMGRAVFAPFTDTPIEDIQVLSTLSNPEDDVKKMMKWVTMNGIRDDDANLKFERIMPGYSAHTVIYNTADCTFMMVSDQMGKYIYGWPGGRGVAIQTRTPTAQLGMSESSRSNLRGLSEKTNSLESAYHQFMESPLSFVKDATPVATTTTKPMAPKMPSQPHVATGQSNSTTGSIAPGERAPEAPVATTPPSVPKTAAKLNPAQQAAKDKTDAARAKVN